jgi:predicted metal-dependent hydrolase
VSKKSAKIAALIENCQGGTFDPHYLGYFQLFNQQLFYEAHDVLEELWLANRSGPNYALYKGLIQLAGAFVHLQKSRLKPSAALFKLAQANLLQYATPHEGLDISVVLSLIAKWLGDLESANYLTNPFESSTPPQLALVEK